MKIALLNLPVDNNYGGHLQRFALITYLHKLGYQVTHINLISRAYLPWYKKPYSYTKRFILKYFFNKNIPIFLEKEVCKQNDVNCKLFNLFYDKYIPHTIPVYNIKDIKKICRGNFNAYIVGSDQVWRKSMTSQIGIDNYFLKFVEKENVKRIAYAVSLGVEENEFTDKDLKKLSHLYRKFNFVSVREINAVDVILQNKWFNPKPVLTIDPTLLLSKEDYVCLIENGRTVSQTINKIYCYILDYDKQIDDKIRLISFKKQLTYLIHGLNTTDSVSIEQWLRNIKDAQMIVTDSYHGVVFSIIFNKSFMFLGNNKRGNARIESLFSLLNINKKDTLNIDWDNIRNIIHNKVNEISYIWNLLN